MTADKILKILYDDGWVVKSHKGTSHIQLTHPTKPGKITVPYHKGKELNLYTEKSILKQAGIK